MIIRLCLALALTAVAEKPAKIAQKRVLAAAEAAADASEPRRYDAERLGRACLGRGYSVYEASEILARMTAWLASAEAHAAPGSGEEAVRRLLETAARRAHPGIVDGAGSRSAANWTDFVVSAAALKPASAASAAVVAARR